MRNLMLRNSEDVGRDLVGSGMCGAISLLPNRGRRLVWLNRRSLPGIMERLGVEDVPWVLCREWGPETPETAVIMVACDSALLHKLAVGLRRMGLAEVHQITWLDSFRSARSWVFHWQIQSRVKGVEFDLAWSRGVKGLDGLAMSLAIVTAASVGRLQGVGQA